MIEQVGMGVAVVIMSVIVIGGTIEFVIRESKLGKPRGVSRSCPRCGDLRRMVETGGKDACRRCYDLDTGAIP